MLDHKAPYENLNNISKKSIVQVSLDNSLELSGNSQLQSDLLIKIERDQKNDYKSSASALVLRNIHKTYLIGIEGVPALRGVSLSIPKGEFLIIFGTSGGGKTTMLNIIGTIDTPSRGDVKVFDKLIRSTTTDDELSKIRLEKVAFVFQAFNLFPNLNVIENVEIPMKIKGELSSADQRARAIQLLTKVGLQHRLNHFPNQLSGGEQQRVTIARALVNRPEILLLDEPTGDLDTKNADIIMSILMELNLNEGITMVMVTHDVGLKNYAHRVVKVIDGKINHESVVAAEEREECVKKLFERIESKKGIREGVGDNSAEAPGRLCENSKTVYRKVTDYHIKKSGNNA